MSEITMRKCDGCGRTVPDRSAEVGWLHFDAHRITRALGRRENREYLRSDANVFDFCSPGCMDGALRRTAPRPTTDKEPQP